LGALLVVFLTLGSPGTNDVGNEHPANTANARLPIHIRMMFPFAKKVNVPPNRQHIYRGIAPAVEIGQSFTPIQRYHRQTTRNG